MFTFLKNVYIIYVMITKKGVVLMVKIYSTGCPQCEVLEEKLKDNNIEFELETDINKMKELGITQVPVLEVDDNLLSFMDAVKWINKR